MTTPATAARAAASMRFLAGAIDRLRALAVSEAAEPRSMLVVHSAMESVTHARAAASRALSDLADDLSRTMRDARLEAAMNQALMHGLLIRAGVVGSDECEAIAAWLDATWPPAPAPPAAEIVP